MFDLDLLSRERSWDVQFRDTPHVPSRRKTNLKVSANFSRNFVSEETLGIAPIDAANDFADHKSICGRVIAEHLFATEAVWLGRDLRRNAPPISQFMRRHRHVKERYPTLMREEIAHCDLVFSVLAERRPIPADRRVEIKLAALA